MRVRIFVMGFLAIAISVAACRRSNKNSEPSAVSSAAPNVIYLPPVGGSPASKYAGTDAGSSDPTQRPAESQSINFGKITTSYSKPDAGQKR